MNVNSQNFSFICNFQIFHFAFDSPVNSNYFKTTNSTSTFIACYLLLFATCSLQFALCSLLSARCLFTFSSLHVKICSLLVTLRSSFVNFCSMLLTFRSLLADDSVTFFAFEKYFFSFYNSIWIHLFIQVKNIVYIRSPK